MIDLIAKQLSNYLNQNVTWVDRYAGLVKPMRKKVGNEDKVFPVAINTPSTCDVSDYMSLVPDNTKSSILYIEKMGDVSIEQTAHGYSHRAVPLRIVVWYNLDKITEGKYISEDTLIDDVMNVLPRSLPDYLFTGCGVKRVHFAPTGVVIGTDIVAQYTYNEIKTQFGIHPFGIFAIDVDCWYIAVHCKRPYSAEDGCETGKGNVLHYPEPLN